MNETPQPQPKKRSRLIISIIIIVLAVVAIAVSLFFLTNPDGIETAADKSSSSVTITERGVAPPTVSVKKGESITWTNQDTAQHKLVITSPNPPRELEGFGSDEPMAQGDSYSFTFEAKGSFTYQDPTNPQKIQGTIIVE